MKGLQICRDLFFLPLVFGLAQARAGEVVHIAQNHGHQEKLIGEFLTAIKEQNEPPDLNLEEFRRTYASQKEVYALLVSELGKDKEVAVYNEGTLALPSQETCEDLRSVFPKGTFDPSNTTYEQMLSLVKESPAVVLHCIGQLKNLLPGDEKGLLVKGTISLYTGADGMKGAFEDREVWLAGEVRARLEKDKQHNVLIVFGAAHDFYPYFTETASIPGVSFKRQETPGVLEKKSVSFDPLLDFSFSQTGRWTRTEDDKKASKILTNTLRELFVKASPSVKNLRNISLLPPPQGEKSTFDYVHLLYMDEKESLSSVRDAFYAWQVVKALSESSDLNDFMTRMAPMYHPAYRWDDTLQAIVK